MSRMCCVMLLVVLSICATSLAADAPSAYGFGVGNSDAFAAPAAPGVRFGAAPVVSMRTGLVEGAEGVAGFCGHCGPGPCVDWKLRPWFGTWEMPGSCSKHRGCECRAMICP